MMSRFPTSFAERNKVAVALIGIVSLIAVFAVTFSAESLPVIGGGTMHTAKFAEAGGLHAGDNVRVAGVKVGKVTDISLDGKVVLVDFRVKGVQLGSQTSAAVKVSSLLGQKYLSIDPLGSGKLEGAIPLAHTTTPYDVNAALSDLSTTVDEINTPQLEKSFNVLADVFKDTPKSVRTMVAGLTDLSRTISSRDTELAGLLASTNTVTKTLKGRNAEFAKIINDGDSLLGELRQRREAVQKMLEGTARLGTELQGLVKDNEKQLRPALAKLDEVTRILQNNQDNLAAAVEQLGPYYRVLASATGNGRWLDSYVCGLFDDKNAPLLQNDVARNCDPTKGGRP